MTRIAPVSLMYSSKTLWFDAGELEAEVGQNIVVTTARGTEYGTLAEGIFEATEDQLATLKTELKPVVRLATQEDDEQAEKMKGLSEEAMPVFKEYIAEEELDMRPISIEYLLGGDKAVFYFEAEERVDFRELVKKLAGKLHVRVELRQIGVRDEARLIGGLGHCGQELCCKRLTGEFNPVSIKMAKEQNLSLNPEKISGLCGRLMCCLRYEYETYKEFHGRCPKMGALIKTPEGDAKVVELDVPREVVTLKLEDDKTVKVPLANFDAAKEGTRPNTIGDEAWEEANNTFESAASVASLFHTDLFTAPDKLGDKKATHREPAPKNDDINTGGRKLRRGTKRFAEQETTKPTKRTRRPKRSVKIGAQTEAEGTVIASENQANAGQTKVNRNESKHSNSKQSETKLMGRLRPGRNSSGLSRAKNEEAQEPASNNKHTRSTHNNRKHQENRGSRNNQAAQSAKTEQKPTTVSVNRTRRRRSHTSNPSKES